MPTRNPAYNQLGDVGLDQLWEHFQCLKRAQGDQTENVVNGPSAFFFSVHHRLEIKKIDFFFFKAS